MHHIIQRNIDTPLKLTLEIIKLKELIMQCGSVCNIITKLTMYDRQNISGAYQSEYLTSFDGAFNAGTILSEITLFTFTVRCVTVVWDHTDLVLRAFRALCVRQSYLRNVI